MLEIIKMQYFKPNLATLFLLALLAFSCQKTDPVINPKPVDLTLAKMSDFQFSEFDYADINVVHPTVNNGIETKQGEITVIVPKGSTSLKLTPKTSNFTSDKFTITPALGQLLNFSNGKVTFTISSKENPSANVHYDITVQEEQGSDGTPTGITSFKFERSKNPGLPADIVSTRIVHGLGTMGKIYVFVPLGTDFSRLTATINYSGSFLYYSQDANSVPANATTTYPAGGLSINFSYPKVFYAIVKKGTEVKVYDVIVDVKNPVRFDRLEVVTPDVAAGADKTLQLGTFLNQGNHPITITGINHIDRVPAGVNAIRGFAGIPSGGVKPNERGEIFAVINAKTYPAGTYKATAVFTPAINNDSDGSDLLNPSSLTITSKIVE